MKKLKDKWIKFMLDWRGSEKHRFEHEGEMMIAKPQFYDFMEYITTPIIKQTK